MSRSLGSLIPYSVLVFAIALIAIATASKRTPTQKPTVLLYPPEQMKLFSFGYSETLADIMWLRVIQDYEICEQSSAPLDAPQVPVLGPDGKPTNPRPKARCHLGWVYQLIDATTELAPRFKIPYVTGASMLSIVVDDREGATRIYEKAVKQFPEDWNLHYRVAYHYLYELQDVAKAAEHLRRAGELGAPQWVFALAAKLYSKAGRAQLGIPILEEALARDPEGEMAPRLRKRLAELKAELTER